jgi:ATP-dependent helicase HepA
MASNMREQLTTLATLLRRFLGRELPALGPDWWNQGVLAKLSYQQRAQADEQHWSTLDHLDVAATLRVVDQNWDLFRRRGLVKWDDRNWLKEAASVRNRHSHDAPRAAIAPAWSSVLKRWA